jgi:hypothetical protein
MNEMKTNVQQLNAQGKYGKVVCHDPSLGLTTKARTWKGASRECSMGVTFTLLGMWESVRE